MDTLSIIILTLGIFVLLEGLILFFNPRVLIRISKKPKLLKKIGLIEIITSIIAILFIFFINFW